MTDAPLLAGVLGWPVSHSRSPRLHGHWLARYGIAGHYVPLAVKPDNLAAALSALPMLGFRGVNITLPHKEAALALAAGCTDRAALIGAANTLTFRGDGSFEADNTDAFGFLENLRQHAPGWHAASGPALVLGAGGAARAVVHALLADGAPEVRLANRTRGRAETLADRLGAQVKVWDWSDVDQAMRGAKTIANTTSLGMAGQPPLEIGFQWAPEDALVTDAVYDPLITPFLRAAAAGGLRTVDGLGMLLHQAAPGFEKWFGVRPEVDGSLRAAVIGPW